MTLKNALACVVVLLALAGSFAGYSNLTSLNITPTSSDTYSLRVDNTSATRIFSITAAGVVDQPAVAAQFNIGSASSTTGSKVAVFDGGADNKPGAIALYDDTGTPMWMFVSSAGALRTHTAYPTDDDSDGTLVGTTNLAVDFDLTAAGGSTGDPDFSVAGYSHLAGVLEVDGAAQLDGAATVAGLLSPTGLVAFGDKAELTLDGAGAVTATGVYHTIDTAGDAASGDLVTIAAGVAGQILVLQCEHTDRSVVVKSTGNILPVGGDITMDETTCSLTLIYSAALSKWVITGSYGN